MVPGVFSIIIVSNKVVEKIKTSVLFAITFPKIVPFMR